jgi:hypothetical protein
MCRYTVHTLPIHILHNMYTLRYIYIHVLIKTLLMMHRMYVLYSRTIILASILSGNIYSIIITYTLTLLHECSYYADCRLFICTHNILHYTFNILKVFLCFFKFICKRQKTAINADI